MCSDENILECFKSKASICCQDALLFSSASVNDRSTTNITFIKSKMVCLDAFDDTVISTATSVH